MGKYAKAVGMAVAAFSLGVANARSVEGSGGYFLDAGVYERLDTMPSVVAQRWRKLAPTGINNHGWVVGTGTNPDGELRAFLLIPGITPVKMKPARFSAINAARASRTAAP